MRLSRGLYCHMAAALVGIGMSICAVMLFDRREPLLLIEGTIEPNQVRMGDTVQVAWVVEERRNCDGELRRIIIDSAKKVHEFAIEKTVYHETLTRDRRVFVKPMVIPSGLTPGPAIYTTQIWRWCNPAQQHLWPIRSEGLRVPFVVLE